MLLSVFVLAGCGSINRIEVNTVTKDVYVKDDLQIPVAKCNDKTVETKINTYIQLYELQNLYLNNPNTLFDKVNYIDEDSIVRGKTYIEYKEIRNDEICWSFSLQEIESWLTMHYWNRYYNFNPQTGDIYLCKDFIDSSKLDDFTKLVYDETCKQLIPKYIGDTNVYKKDYPDSVSFLDIVTLSTFHNIWDYYYFTSDSLYFDIFSLLHKTWQFVFEKTTLSLPIADIKPYLNDLVRNILVEKTINRKPIKRFDNKLYEVKQTDGQEFYFIPYDVDIRFDSVKYFYGLIIDKQGNNFVILEDGVMNKEETEIQFQMLDEKGENIGLFYVFIDGNSLSGKITDMKKKELSQSTIKVY